MLESNKYKLVQWCTDQAQAHDLDLLLPSLAHAWVDTWAAALVQIVRTWHRIRPAPTKCHDTGGMWGMYDRKRTFSADSTVDSVDIDGSCEI